ncbi:MAG: helix-turn-helix domain-containing protein, partial [Cyclobacteriaceae bacterium]
QGTTTALIFAFVLLASKTNKSANQFLTFLILALGVNLVTSWFLLQGVYDRFPILQLLPFGVSFGLGPLLYYYVHTLCNNEPTSRMHLWWFLADFPHGVYHLIAGREITHEGFHNVLDKLGFLALPVIVFYLWKSWKIIIQYQKELPNRLSNVEQQTLRWLRQVTLLFLIFIPIGLAFWLLLITTGLNLDDRTVVYGFHLLSIFWLGIGGIRQPEIMGRSMSRHEEEKNEDNRFRATHLQALLQSMEQDKLYLMPDLNVRFLEEKLGLTARQISDALNQGLGKNFYTFINEYRVKEFQRKVNENPNLTLAGLALECGFNSKTTFQRVFKEVTGMRPAEFARTTLK